MIHGRKQKGKTRYYELPDHIMDTFEQYIKIRQSLNKNEHFMFVSCSKNTGWTTKGMQRLFRNLKKELGFRVIAYGFRRFVATELNKQGLDKNFIKNHLGHTRITTTERYIESSCILTNPGTKILSKIY